MTQRSRVFSISIVLFALSAAAQQKGLTASSRHESAAQFKAQLEYMGERARDFRQHEKALDAYEEEVARHVSEYKKKKQAQDKALEEARKQYVREKKSKKIVPLDAYRPAWEADEARKAAQYRKSQDDYARQQEELRRMRTKEKYKIPEDKEVGLDYEKI